jgi:hypothetical protein
MWVTHPLGNGLQWRWVPESAAPGLETSRALHLRTAHSRVPLQQHEAYETRITTRLNS